MLKERDSVALDLIVKDITVPAFVFRGGVLGNSVQAHSEISVTGHPQVQILKFPGMLPLENGDRIRAYFPPTEPRHRYFGFSVGSKERDLSQTEIPLKLEKMLGSEVVATYLFPRATQLVN